ncbi:hypothetical protein F5Y06DRAFT_301729 [Hypoxylon sp. FL0890]|nr:hypothetical protein F5Y06DRAFT_301729 [Hypoxylon sp. FL0890]
MSTPEYRINWPTLAYYSPSVQLQDVKAQLEIQLKILNDKLLGLQNTLKLQEKALSRLQAAFWGSVAAMFLGMALGVLALATGVGAGFVIAAGALFVAGFVATVALGVEIDNAPAAILAENEFDPSSSSSARGVAPNSDDLEAELVKGNITITHILENAFTVVLRIEEIVAK